VRQRQVGSRQQHANGPNFGVIIAGPSPTIVSRLNHPAAVLALAFLCAIALGSLLLWLPAARAGDGAAPALVALFTAASAVCVTGLVVVDTGTYWSPLGQAIILGLFQMGGFGIMTAATLLGLLVNRQLRVRSKLLLQAETHTLGVGDLKSVAKLVLAVTVATEAVVALVLSMRFALAYDFPWREAAWHGIFHSVSAFNNAGFSTWPDSVSRFVADPLVLVPLMLAIVLGGIGFPVLHELWRSRSSPRPLSIHASLTLWGTAGLLLGGALMLLLVEWNNPRTLGGLDWPSRVLAAIFTSTSARTAGFNAIDIGGLALESLNLHYLLMFIGGGSAGTAGGVKITTFFVLLLIVWSEVRGYADVEFKGRRLANQAQRQALTILVLSAGTVVVATMVIVPMTPIPFEKVVFEVISAFATVGLSTGITADLPPAAQLVLVFLMFAGRVGIVTLAAAIAVNVVRRSYRFPEERPIVG
jgi:trk system potassium uptake protein TrkH